MTHAVGSFLSLLGLAILLYLSYGRINSLYAISAVIFGLSMFSLYSASALYHYVRSPLLKQLFRLIDHSSIYILIAGTYTPVTLLAIHNILGYILLSVIWLLAFAGIILELSVISYNKWISVSFYLLMGWLALVATKALLQNLSVLGIFGLFAGGVAYSVGVIFYVWHTFPFNHAIWHFFVLAGTFFHFIMIYSIYTNLAQLL